MSNRKNAPESDTNEEPEQPEAEAALEAKPFRGELLGLRPSSRAGLSAARLSAADRLRRYMQALKKQARGEEDEPC